MQTYGNINAADIFRADGLYANTNVSGLVGMTTTPTQDIKHRVVWTEEEDRLLRELISKHGSNKWSVIASKIPFKSNKHCRRRWQACLNVVGNKGVWTSEEDAKLLEGHRLFGNRWTELAKLVPGRTDNAAKNRFMALTKREVASTASDSGLSDSGLVSPLPLRDVSSRAPGGMKRSRAPVVADALSPCSKKVSKAGLDLNVRAEAAAAAATGCFSGSESSELVQDSSEEWAESAHPQSSRAWLDLNVPYAE